MSKAFKTLKLSMKRFGSYKNLIFVRRHSTVISDMKINVLFIVTMLLFACTGSYIRPEPPIISVIGLETQEVGIIQQQYRLTLRVKNPNNFDVTVKNINFDMFVNGKHLVSGESSDAVRIPSGRSAEVELDVTTGLYQLINQLKQLEKVVMHGSMPYELKGNIRLADVRSGYKFTAKGDLLRK